MHLITEGDPPMIMAAVTKNNKQGLSAASTHRFKARLVPIKFVGADLASSQFGNSDLVSSQFGNSTKLGL